MCVYYDFKSEHFMIVLIEPSDLYECIQGRITFDIPYVLNLN